MRTRARIQARGGGRLCSRRGEWVEWAVPRGSGGFSRLREATFLSNVLKRNPSCWAAKRSKTSRNERPRLFRDLFKL